MTTLKTGMVIGELKGIIRVNITIVFLAGFCLGGILTQLFL